MTWMRRYSKTCTRVVQDKFEKPRNIFIIAEENLSKQKETNPSLHAIEEQGAWKLH
jgi:hypothetical protein